MPSLFDPPWVNDEGTYFAVAQAMSHGFRLYQDIWENKPPAIYLMYMAVYHLAGPSLLAIRLLSAMTACALVILTFLIARHYAGHRTAAAAAMLCGLVLDIPFLEGTTGNAELFASAGTALAVYCAVVRERVGVAGTAAACAIIVKAVVCFDAAALTLYLLQHRRLLIAYAAACTCVLLVAGALAARSGILGAMLRDAFLYDLGYVGRANGRGMPWLIVAKGIALAGATWYLRRAPFPFLWFVYTLAGALLSGRVFGHYFIQCIVPLSVCLAILWRNEPMVGRRALVGLPLGFFALAALSSMVGWGLAAEGHDSILARRLQWYSNFVRYAAGSESYVAYRDQIDDHVSRNIAVAKEIKKLPAGKLLVWGNTPWVYVLAERLPATPYTSALRNPEVPNETMTLRRATVREKPTVIVVVEPPSPSLGEAASAIMRLYVPRSNVQNARIYVAETARL